MFFRLFVLRLLTIFKEEYNVLPCVCFQRRTSYIFCVFLMWNVITFSCFQRCASMVQCHSFHRILTAMYKDALTSTGPNTS